MEVVGKDEGRLFTIVSSHDHMLTIMVSQFLIMVLLMQVVCLLHQQYCKGIGEVILVKQPEMRMDVAYICSDFSTWQTN